MKIEPARRPPDHPVFARKVGVLIVNLGTPDAATPAAVRRYLAAVDGLRRAVERPFTWGPACVVDVVSAAGPAGEPGHMYTL